MSYRDGAAFGDLIEEQRDDAALGGKNVAESYRHELGGTREAERLTVDLANPLACTHHASRFDRLVGRNEKKSGNLELIRDSGQGTHPAHIVLETLDTIELLHRYMFVRPRMKH